MIGQIRILGRQLAQVYEGGVTAALAAVLQRPKGGIFFCNVHMLMLSQEEPSLAEAMARAVCVFADGVPVALLQRQISGKQSVAIRGYEMMLAACKFAEAHGESIGLLGSTETVMNKLCRNLHRQFPSLRVAFRYCPPFSNDELRLDAFTRKSLTEAKPDWLFVGLGCPKQETWIDHNFTSLGCRVLGVGAAFDWLAGTTQKPPQWMEKFALAWLFRLLLNPKRMWRRYLIYNVKFLWQYARILFAHSLRSPHPRGDGQ